MSNIVPISATVSRDLIVFDNPKKELIRKTVASDLSAPDFELFIAVAQARGLDPVLRQIYAIMRAGKMVLQVGIDGARLVAARTGEYAGNDAPVFSRDESDALVATVTIWRMIQGQRVAFTGVAYWAEFYPGDKQGAMWIKMPRSQLSKCAEMQALRKGFPNDLGGLYAPEETERDITEAEPAPASLGVNDGAKAEKDARVLDLISRFRKIGVSASMICERYQLDDAGQLTDEQLKELSEIGPVIAKDKKKMADYFKAGEF